MVKSNLTEEDAKYFGVNIQNWGADDLERLEEVEEPRRRWRWGDLVLKYWMPVAIITIVLGVGLVVQGANKFARHHASWQISGR